MYNVTYFFKGYTETKTVLSLEYALNWHQYFLKGTLGYSTCLIDPVQNVAL